MEVAGVGNGNGNSAAGAVSDLGTGATRARNGICSF